MFNFMNQFLAIIFLLRIFYWLITTILKCFGIIKSEEPAAVDPQSQSVAEQNQSEKEQELIHDPQSQLSTSVEYTKGKKRPPKKKKTKSKVTNPQKPEQSSQPPPAQITQPLPQITMQQIQGQIQQQKMHNYMQNGYSYYQRPPMMDASTQTDIDVDELQQKIAMLEELTRKTILQEINYKKQVIGKISDEIFRNPLLQQLQSDLDGDKLPEMMQKKNGVQVDPTQNVKTKNRSKKKKNK